MRDGKVGPGARLRNEQVQRKFAAAVVPAGVQRVHVECLPSPVWDGKAPIGKALAGESRGTSTLAPPADCGATISREATWLCSTNPLESRR